MPSPLAAASRASSDSISTCSRRMAGAHSACTPEFPLWPTVFAHFRLLGPPSRIAGRPKGRSPRSDRRYTRYAPPGVESHVGETAVDVELSYDQELSRAMRKPPRRRSFFTQAADSFPLGPRDRIVDWSLLREQVSVGCRHRQTSANGAQDILQSVRVKCGHFFLP